MESPNFNLKMEHKMDSKSAHVIGYGVVGFLCAILGFIVGWMA